VVIQLDDLDAEAEAMEQKMQGAGSWVCKWTTVCGRCILRSMQDAPNVEQKIAAPQGTATTAWTGIAVGKLP
jgi:hypothetical protein